MRELEDLVAFADSTSQNLLEEKQREDFPTMAIAKSFVSESPWRWLKMIYRETQDEKRTHICYRGFWQSDVFIRRNHITLPATKRQFNNIQIHQHGGRGAKL